MNISGDKPAVPDPSGAPGSIREELQRSQEFIQILVEHAGATIAILDDNNIYQFINVAGASRFGLTPRQVQGKKLFDLFEPCDALMRAQRNKQLIDTGQGCVNDLPHTKPTGEVRWYRSSAQPLRNAAGKVDRLLAVSTDITESKRAQEALRDSQVTTAALLNASSDRAALCEVSGLILAGNRAAADSFGLSPEELIGKNIWDLLPKELAQSRRRHMPKVLAGHPVAFEDRRDDTILANNYYPIADADGRVTRFAMFGRDITIQRRAQEALQRSEERLRAILASLHDTAIVVFDRQGVVQSIWIDPLLDGTFGPKSALCIGKSIFDILPNDAARRRMPLIENVFAHGHSARDEYDTPVGQVFEASLAPMRDADGNVIAAVAFVLDVTKRKRAEEALRQAHHQLMAAREMECRRLSQELHDSVGQGLIVLDMAIKNAIANCEGKCPDTADFLQRAVAQCSALIKEVRDMSHGLYPATLESLGLVASLKQLAHDCRGKMLLTPHCEETGQSRLPPDVEIALYRIAQEAIKNAIGHSQGKHLDLSLRRQNDSILMEMCDDGVGFDPSKLPSGSMGLANMTERAHAVGGELSIDSKPGQTRITIRVPTYSQ